MSWNALLVFGGGDKLGSVEWKRGKAGGEKERQDIRFKPLCPQNTTEEDFQTRGDSVILPLGFGDKTISSVY